MNIKLGDMYMMPLTNPSNVYGWSVNRVWWLPWRYNLSVYHFGKRSGANGEVIEIPPAEVHGYLTWSGVLGMVKLLDLWEGRWGGSNKTG